MKLLHIIQIVTNIIDLRSERARHYILSLAGITDIDHMESSLKRIPERRKFTLSRYNDITVDNSIGYLVERYLLMKVILTLASDEDLQNKPQKNSRPHNI